MAHSDPLYLGFDLSTQQLKCIAVTPDLRVVNKVTYDFDADSKGYGVHKGVLTNEEEHEVFAPVKLWLEAMDTVLTKLKDSGLDFGRVKGLSGAGMQHGAVFWSSKADNLLSSLSSQESLKDQLREAFSHPFSPNWQDASTQKECDEFDAELGSEERLADATGSKAHHRFTGLQILRFRRKHSDAYEKTARISLVSSFLASMLLGAVAPFDISDVCGMNLWDIKAATWQEKLLRLVAGSEEETTRLKERLGPTPVDGGERLGTISRYFVDRFGFDKDAIVIASSGDNPATIIALPLRQNDAIVSLGTSTTFLMSTPEYKPDPSTHFFNHPTTPGLYMFMLCYKNGGLAREQVRDRLNRKVTGVAENSWDQFDRLLLETSPLAQSSPEKAMKIGLYFPRPEIVPNLPAGEWHFDYNPQTKSLEQRGSEEDDGPDNARLIVESQLLSLRLRSLALVQKPSPDLPPQPRRIYLVGGGSRNKAIAKVAGEVLGGSEGIFKLDVGENACALGAAYKAVWAVERSDGQTFEDFIGDRWREADFVEKIADGYQKDRWEKYGEVLDAFGKMENMLLDQHSKVVGTA